jgi:hypothetical protein
VINYLTSRYRIASGIYLGKSFLGTVQSSKLGRLHAMQANGIGVYWTIYDGQRQKHSRNLIKQRTYWTSHNIIELKLALATNAEAKESLRFTIVIQRMAC